MTLKLTAVALGADGSLLVSGTGGASSGGPHLLFGADGGGIESDGAGGLKLNSLPLSSGAATAANQATQIADLVSLVTNTTGLALDATLAALSAKLAALGQHTGASSLSVVPASDTGPVVIASAPASYRTAITAADVIANPGTVTTSLLTGVGSAPAGTYNVKVVAGNQYGRTMATTGSGTVVTTGANLAGRAAFAQVPGATYYDIYFSIDADPKWVGRITETQRASGIIINSVGGTTAGGTAGAVDIYVAGTGLQAATTAAQNTAYSIPADVDCTGHQFVDFDLTPSRTGDATSIAVTVIPFFLNSRLSRYSAGDPKTMVFGGTSGAYNSLTQSYRVEARGRHVALVVAAITGTGASVDIDYTLS